MVPFVRLQESRRTLGLLLSPPGQWKDQRDKMRESMEQWAEASKAANLNRYDAMIELKTRVFPKLLYGLEATSLSKRDCRYIMAPALTAGLNLCGTTRILPREIVFGPESLLGLDIPDIYI